MSQEERSSLVVPRAPRTCRGKEKGRRRSSHFTNPKQLKAQRERRHKKTLCEIVDVDGSSDDSQGLKVRSLEALTKVRCLHDVMFI